MKIKTLQVGHLGVNCYLCYDEKTKEVVIIDPGDEAISIEKFIDANNLIPKAIMLTHSHFDHICAVPELKKKYDIPVAVYEAEKDLVADANKNLTNSFYSLGISIEPDILLTENEVYSPFSAAEGFTVIHTPGHTKGGACFYVKGKNAVFTGDTLFSSSIGRTDFPTGNFDEIIDSIKNKLMLLPDDTTVYPGHGMASTIGNERRDNPFIN